MFPPLDEAAAVEGIAKWTGEASTPISAVCLSRLYMISEITSSGNVSVL